MSSSALAMVSWAPGATPLYLPFEAAPLPATMDATWVPWPTRSVTSSGLPPPGLPSGTKLRAAAIRPCRSGCAVSTPESMMPTFAPVPS